MRTSALVLSILVGTAGLCSGAHAQAWLPDRNYTEGPGIRIGNLEMHPGLAVRAGWDSNVFRQEGSAANPRISSGLIAITPHLNLSTLGKQRQTQGETVGAAGGAGGLAQPPITFDGGASLTYFQYTKGDVQPDGVNIGVDLGGSLRILPSKPVSFELGAGYQRNVQPFTNKLPTDDQNYANNIVVPAARVNFRSKSAVLAGFVGYAPLITRYEDRARAFRYLNGEAHSIQAGSSWKFLPHTALLFDGELALQHYTNVNAPSATTLISDGKRFQARLGLNGAFTQKLNLRLMVGYGLVAFDREVFSEYENAIGEAVLGYRIAAAHSFEVGYGGNVQTAAIGGWMRTDRGFARLKMLFAGAFSLAVEAGGGYVKYGRVLGPSNNAAQPDAPGLNFPVVGLGEGGSTDRHDVRVDGALRAEYRITNWLALLADVTVLANITDFEYELTTENPTDPMAPPIVFPDPAKFYTVQVYGGVRAHY